MAVDENESGNGNESENETTASTGQGVSTTGTVKIDIPAGCWRQPDESAGVSDAGEPSFNFILKGGYDALDTLQASLTKGEEVMTGWLARSWTLQRTKSDGGILTIVCRPDAGETDGEEPEAKPLKDVWKIHTVRNDLNILAYCGPSPANPSRYEIEMWMKETDGTLAENYQFRDELGEVKTLSNQSHALAEKIKKGVESVVRCHPVIIRQRTYSAPPPDCMVNINLIDTPAITDMPGVTKRPGTLGTRLAAYHWLKMQDDCDENADGNWTRTESWWGAASWDADFYGPNRWTVPAFPGGSGSSNSNPGGPSSGGGA